MRIVALTCNVVHTVIARYAKRKDICNFETDSALKDRSCNSLRKKSGSWRRQTRFGPTRWWRDTETRLPRFCRPYFAPWRRAEALQRPGGSLMMSSAISKEKK